MPGREESIQSCSVARFRPTKIRGGNRRNRRETAVDEGRKEMADRVARYQAD